MANATKNTQKEPKENDKKKALDTALTKIKKDFGLDLRSFRDAVVFRIISEIASETPYETRN